MEKQFNYNLKRYIFLETGEKFCPVCGGRGRIYRDPRPHSPTLKCYKCLGEGKIDWIERIVGKKVKHEKY